MPSFSISTLGCRANQADSERMAQLLRAAGWVELSADSSVDVALVNTCSITAEADHKSRKLLKRRQRLAQLVVATGCSVAERGGMGEVPAGVCVINPHEQDTLLERLSEWGYPENLQGEADVCQHRTRALIRVQDGCNHFCTYCIVPYVRGRLHSFPIEDLVPQVQRLEREGFKEIVLTGIHLSMWGHETSPQRDMAYLLQRFLEATQTVRFRLSSVEPISFPRSLLQLMRECPERLCPHLHLPLQHASDAILKRMRRDYTLAEYDDLVQEFRQVPGAVLTTDILLGFPGESEDDMQILLDYLDKTPYYHLHVFPYSRRPGTAANTYPDQIDERLKKQRVERVIAFGEVLKERVLAQFRGTTRPVLVERLVPGTGLVTGTADNYISVQFPGDASMLGTIVMAQVN